jgi:ferredoxin--NADP+ reductase
VRRGQSFQPAEGAGPARRRLRPPASLSEPLRIAVVGSGLLALHRRRPASGLALEVDMLERLPTPWGLVRFGVAPDHPNIKSVSRAFERIANTGDFRFFGNVEVGEDVHHADLERLYDAVVYTVGAQADRRLNIPGEDLAGSWAATELVAWYNGHPDYQHLPFDLSGQRAVVIGNGNVAIDVARMLALTAEELAPTDTTDEAIAALGGSGIREIVMLGRRGPAQAAFSPRDRARRARGSRRDRPGRPRARPCRAAAAWRTGVAGGTSTLREFAARAAGQAEAPIPLLRLPVTILGEGSRGDRLEQPARPRRSGGSGRADGRGRGAPAASSSAASATRRRAPGVPFDQRRTRSATRQAKSPARTARSSGVCAAGSSAARAA